jgi:hypothetical protein
MKISYAIPVCNEFMEIQRLISFLLQTKQPDDEVVVLFDSTNGSKSVEEYLRSHSVNGEFIWHSYEFDGHFGNMKNHLTSLCSGDYIFQIDADEMVDNYLFAALPQVLEHNEVDVILVPRINTVEGLTHQHVSKWGWRVDGNGWVNFPDYQWRIYRNTESIRWKNRVHETLDGYKTLSHLPRNPEWCLMHHKTIDRQERQNQYYETL